MRLFLSTLAPVCASYGKFFDEPDNCSFRICEIIFLPFVAPFLLLILSNYFLCRCPLAMTRDLDGRLDFFTEFLPVNADGRL